MTNTRFRAVSLSLLLVLSVVAGSVAFSGAATAATNVSITPDDATVDATNVTYTAEGDVQLGNQDTLNYVDVHLSPANVSAVGADDVTVFVDGNQYSGGITEFSASNGTVEFKLSDSESLSDGDHVEIAVADVTNPSSNFTANATLHDSGDAQFQEFQDDVVITDAANIVYDDLTVNDTSVDTGDDVRVSATVQNTGGESGTYNASLTVDGTTTASNEGTLTAGESTTTAFVTDFDSTGAYDVGIEELGPTTVSVSDELNITDGSASPTEVQPGTTVDNQNVSYTVTNLSQDGDTDVHYVEFPDALASGLSINSADSNATSITSSANLVDGFDGDGTDDTVKFATSGDGGGGIDATLSTDISVTYPSTNDTYAIDVRTVDSDGEVVTRTGVTSISASGESTDDGTTDDGNDADGNTESDNSDDMLVPAGDEEIVDDVDLIADGEDVDLVVTSDESLDRMTVAVSGPVDETFQRRDFELSRQDEMYAYTADVTTGTSGTFEATVESAVGDGMKATPDATATLTVGPSSDEGSAAAAPPWPDDSESSHTLSTTVGEDSRVAGETLRSVELGYSDAFLDAGGSVSSVSDDQNVAALTVVGADGTVKSRMGGTDAVTVNTDDGTVSLNLADVDSSRVPTLEAGDRVVVRVRPVTNPEDAGEYDTSLTLGTAGDSSVETDLSLDVRAGDATAAFASTVLTPDDERVSVDLGQSQALDSVALTASHDGSGVVNVAVPEDRPNAAADLSRPVVTVLNITRPDEVEDQSTTVSVSVEDDAYRGSSDSLTLLRYDRQSDEWVELDTGVADTSSETVTVQATTGETSLFAVTSAEMTQTASDADEQDTATPDSSSNEPASQQTATAADGQQAVDVTATSTPAGTETSSSGPGFGITLAVVAALGAVLLLARRD